MSEVTRILCAIEQGDSHAAEQLLPLVYDELRRLAAAKLVQEKPGQTLQATALVHEAYLRLVARGDTTERRKQRWDSRGHFFAAAAEAMRRILIDQTRRKRSKKRGGSLRQITLDAGALLAAPVESEDDYLLALDEALRQLEIEEPLKARLVNLRYFAGLSLHDAALALGISPASAKRHWVYARSWLYGKVHGVR
jgi:RNA polymerase sigma factor (TIGR02999 family)